MNVWPKWRSLSGCLFLALAIESAAGSVPAQAQTTEEQVKKLERDVAELKAALAALAAQTENAPRAAPPAPAGAAEPAPATAPVPDLAELARRIDLLAAEVEALKLGAAAPQAAAEVERVEGFGPAASKVYAVEQGLSIGGYGEMLYQGFDSTRDDGADSGRKDELDFVRAIVYVGYKWDDNWLFNSEIEFEHAKAGEGQRGEVAVEFAYLERRIRPEINARAGLLLLPMGLVNELHEPTTFLGARRPGIENAILPTTWRENGAGVFGEIGPLTYRTYVVNGLEAERFAAGGIRSARQNGARAVAEDLAWVGRLDWTSIPGFVAGVSGYVGDSSQDLADAQGELSVDTQILEAHAEWRGHGFQLRGLWVDAELEDVARLNQKLGLTGNRSVGEELDGYYLEAGYDVLGLVGESRQSLVPFARWETYDTQAAVPTGFARNPANDVEILTLGVNWKPIDQVIFKADWQDVDNGAGTGVDQFNLSLGYIF
jgi:hypothetical protein